MKTLVHPDDKLGLFNHNVTLRRLTMADIDTPLLNRPAVYCGSQEGSVDYATSNGYRWKSSPEMLFGGYYVNDDGDCLLPT